MSLDHLFIEFMHSLCVKFGFILTPLMRLVSILGEKAWPCVIISFIMALHKKRRWVAFTAILSMFLGYILADLLLKPMFMRMRPYTVSNLFQDYWALAGSYKETGYSMPSGHTIGFASFFISLYITIPKTERKMIKNIGTICVVLMIISRCYFMHHYLTDCIVGIVVALITSYTSKVIVRFIFNICKKYNEIALFQFILNFDIVEAFNKNG